MTFIHSTVIWLATPGNWWGEAGLLHRSLEHMIYTLLAVGLACVVAIPLGWFIGHTGRGKTLVIALPGIARALPTLGVITLIGMLMGIGLLGPLIALMILAVPSILAGAYGGIDALRRDTVDAARALGMTEWQILFRVEVPLSLPLLLGGIRSAMLQVLATATLAAYVGSGGLGRLVFLGLKTQNYDMMLAASLAVVVLAIFSEVIFSLAQRLGTPVHR